MTNMELVPVTTVHIPKSSPVIQCADPPPPRKRKKKKAQSGPKEYPLLEFSTFYRCKSDELSPYKIVRNLADTTLFNHHEKLNVCCFNLNSMRSFIRSTYSGGFFRDPFDVIGFCEVQADISNIGYDSALCKYARRYGHCYFNVCSHVPTYSGTALFCYKQPRSVMFGFHEGLPMDFAGRIITARFGDATIILIYAPSKVNENLAFFSILINHVKFEKMFGLPIILMGDLNIPRSDLDASLVRTWSTAGDDFTRNRELLETVISTLDGVDAGQRDHKFTWFPQPNKCMQRRQIGMRIDYIIHDARVL